MSWHQISWRYALILGLGTTVITGCGSDDGEKGAGAPSAGENDSDEGVSRSRDAGASKPGSGSGAGNGLADGGSAPADLPDEVEQPLSFETPKAGKSSVYVPNPDTNQVAVVNASTFNIENLPVGTNPMYAATVPGQDIALVLNTGTRDAALLRTNAQGQTSVLRLDIGHDANAIAIAPDGRRAVVYLNATSAAGATQSFQDLTIVDLTQGAEKARRVSAGFRPRGVQFSSDGARAFVITEDGISILDFQAFDAGPTIARLVGFGDTLTDPQSVDVQVTPSGAYALARRPNDSTLRLIDLTDGKIETLALGTVFAGVPDPDAGVLAPAPDLTDLDMSPDGAFAIAVLRDRGALVRIPLPQGFRDPSALSVRTITAQLIGSVTLSSSGKRAIAYTTALPVEGVVMLDLDSDAPPRSIRLRKAVRGVALSADGSRALVLHEPVGKATAGAGSDESIDASEGYSLVDTNTGFAKLQLTPARVPASGLLLTPDGTRVFTLLSTKSVEMADLQSFQVTSVALSTAPNSIGFVPEMGRVFVGQVGAGGITFLDASSGVKIRSVSGFEIASRIRQ